MACPIYSFSLPLVFAHGIPSAIDSMDDKKLQRFIYFLIKYMKEYTDGEHRREDWWPRDLTKAFKQWSTDKMRQFIYNCYHFYDQVILLEKSKILANVPLGDLEYVTNNQLKNCEMFEIVYLVTNESIAQIPNTLLVSVLCLGCLLMKFTCFAKQTLLPL